MVERHFPAPNRKKTFDLLSMFDDDEASTSNKKGQKRKKTFCKPPQNHLHYCIQVTSVLMDVRVLQPR